MNDSSSLKFSFNGDYEVNALTLSNTIVSLVELTTAVAENGFHGVEFRMGIKAISKGSLTFEFIARAPEAIQTLLSATGVQYAADLITIVSAAFQIKKFLRGHSPKDKSIRDNRLVIKNQEGDVIELSSEASVYFIDQRVDHSVTKIIQNAQASPGVTGITISKEDESAQVYIPRDDFPFCSEDIDIIEAQENRVITSVRLGETIYIRRPDLTGKTQWEFISDTNFKARISDDEFLAKVHAGEIGITAKTYLVADVKVETVITSNGLPDTTSSSYEVVKVHSIQKDNDTQISLFD